MSYDLEKAKQFMEAMKENDERIAQEWNTTFSTTFSTGACYVDTDMVDPHNIGGLPRNSGRYPWNSDGIFNGCVNQEVNKMCIDKEAYKMIINDIITLLRERYGIPYSKVRMKVDRHSDVFPAIDVDISKPECAIVKVIFNNESTIVFWSDNTKTVVKCGDADIFDKEKGLAMAICKKAMGNKGNYYEEFKKWIPGLKVDDNASTSELAILSYGEQVVKGVENAFDILGIKLSKKKKGGRRMIKLEKDFMDKCEHCNKCRT